MKIIISEYADGRAIAFKQWMPDAVVCRRWRGKELPDSFDAWIMGGGPMGASKINREKNSFLADDFALLQEILSMPDAKRPLIVGICLGAQMLTFALNGRVEAGLPVYGWNQIIPTRAHGIYDMISTPIQFEFHSNHIVELPLDVTVLARSEYDDIEAFILGSRIIGVAYHPEVRAHDAQRICKSAHLKANNLIGKKIGNLDDNIALKTSQKFFNTLFF